MEKKRPLVGIGVLIIREGKVPLQKRKSSHGAGEYSLPGGHLEFGESFEECAKRETREECGLEIEKVHFQLVASVNKMYAPKHYVLIGLRADWKSGELQVLEPDKAESWGWYALDNLPQPLFALSKLMVDQYQLGADAKNYFDAQ